MKNAADITDLGQRLNMTYRERVMISSTSHDTRYMMRVLLEMWGFEAIEADGKDETVRLAENYFPAVILVDTSKAFDDDLQVVSEIRGSKVSRSIPIIVLSGFPNPGFQQAAFESGATEILDKPLDLDLLEDYLEKLVPITEH